LILVLSFKLDQLATISAPQLLEFQDPRFVLLDGSRNGLMSALRRIECSLVLPAGLSLPLKEIRQATTF